MTVKTKQQRRRNFAFMRNYRYETHDDKGNIKNNISESQWRAQVIDELKHAGQDKILFVFHDKDKDDSGDPKPLHVHGIIMDKNPRYLAATKEAVKVYNDEFDKNMNYVINLSGAARYLTHTNDEAMSRRKYRYGMDELHLLENGQEVNDEARIRDEYTELIAGADNKENRQLVIAELTNDLLAKTARGEITSKQARRELSDAYNTAGINAYYKRAGQFKSAEEDARTDYHDRLIEEGKSATTVFITGAGRAGKSTMVETMKRIICEHEGLSLSKDVYSAPVSADGLTNDLISGYEDEKIAVFDEIQPSSIGFERFMAVFDDHTIHNVQSRGKSRYFYAEKLFLIKSGISITDYLSRIVESAAGSDNLENLKVQVYGRIAFVAYVAENQLRIYDNRDMSGFNTPVKTYTYDKSIYTDKDKMDKLCEELYTLFYE